MTLRRLVFDISRRRALALVLASQPPTFLVSSHYDVVSAMTSKAYLKMALIVILLGGLSSYLLR